MGLFKKFKELTGTPDKELMARGLLGRAEVTSVAQTGTTVSYGAVEHLVCELELHVTIDGHPSYAATCRQAVPMTAAPILMSGATVAVRVDPADHSRVAIDLSTEPPTVRLGRVEGQRTATDVLREGEPVTAVIVQFQPLGMQNPEGVDLYGFVLNVTAPGRPPYQVQVGNPVPSEAIALIAPGSAVPARVMADDPNGVVLDWTAALAAVS